MPVLYYRSFSFGYVKACTVCMRPNREWIVSLIEYMRDEMYKRYLCRIGIILYEVLY